MMIDDTKLVLESESQDVIQWFADNLMQANADKIQVMMLGKIAFEKCKSLIIGGTEIKCEASVTLLGVTIDYLMNFDTHISNDYEKSS